MKWLIALLFPFVTFGANPNAFTHNNSHRRKPRQRAVKFNNFNIEKQRADESPEDWVFGALSQPGIVSIPLSERLKWLPQGELQYTQYSDFSDCASRSPVNHLEAQFNYAYALNILTPENKRWLEENGYVDNGTITFSDRFIAILSGTTRQGNSLKAPIETIRKSGLVPKKKLPKRDDMTWEQYYWKGDITPSLVELGKEFARRFTINYEAVNTKYHLKDANKDDMIGVAIYAYPAAVDGIYPADPSPMNHAVLCIQPEYFIFDNYGENNDNNDFIKLLAPDYIFYETGYRLYISSQAEDKKKEDDTLIAIYTTLRDLLVKLRDYLLATPQTPQTPPVKPRSRITEWALAIQHAEGGKPNDLNIRMHNPGNLKYTPYTASLGGLPGTQATDGGIFCRFPTYELGLNALCQFLKDACTDKLKSYQSTMSLDEFTKVYASVPLGHPYVKSVAQRLGLPTTAKISTLL